MKNKKEPSYIIPTVLLILIAIAAIFIVTTWVMPFIKEQLSEPTFKIIEKQCSEEYFNYEVWDACSLAVMNGFDYLNQSEINEFSYFCNLWAVKSSKGIICEDVEVEEIIIDKSKECMETYCENNTFCSFKEATMCNSNYYNEINISKQELSIDWLDENCFVDSCIIDGEKINGEDAFYCNQKLEGDLPLNLEKTNYLYGSYKIEVD